jgi:hypothetical protein
MQLQRTIDRFRDPEFQRDLAVWSTLVAFAVIGRWLQPMWNATPTAAVGIFAGFYFTRLRWALTVPIAVMAISHSLLPSYSSWVVMAVVLAAFVLPVVLGRLFARKMNVQRFAAAALLPSLFFYITTNFAVWATSYTHDVAGLVSCYISAIPFYRWMLQGDLVYVGVVFGCYAIAAQRQWFPKPALAVAKR